ncbi:RNA pseudouridine synthase, partial [Bacteriovoracaceae bacterium]|nr:RNA pseudouridine synthase [Bacteriovoracaceae bacterium]
LIISKPERVHCHPLSYLESNNCLSFLRSRGYGEVLKVNKDHYDRGLLFRLDFETSGVLFFTKKESIYEQVRGDFQQVMKEKFYLAIVSNEIEESGTLINVISTKGKTVKEDEKGVTAEISFEKIGSNDKYSLIKIKLGHGHRHQIRAQLKLNGTPILGDTLYGGEESERVWLHALSYEIVINEDEVIKVSDTPELFFSFLNLNSDL